MSDVFDAKAFLKTVTSQPGVYRMYDAGGIVIYVGKAKDLKKRLSSYFRSNLASRKTEALVALIAQIDVTVTHTETEALLETPLASLHRGAGHAQRSIAHRLAWRFGPRARVTAGWSDGYYACEVTLPLDA